MFRSSLGAFTKDQAQGLEILDTMRALSPDAWVHTSASGGPLS